MDNDSTELVKPFGHRVRRAVLQGLIGVMIFFIGGPVLVSAQINYSFPGMQALTTPIPVVSGNNYPKAGDTAVTSNQAFINDFNNHTNLFDSSFIKNIVTFRINEAIPRTLGKPFSATLTYKIYFTGKSGAVYDSVHSNLTLSISYDTAVSAVYNASNNLVFYNGYQVKVQIISLTLTDTSLLKALEVDNTIVFHNYYKFDCTTSGVSDLANTGPVSGTGIPDELPVTRSSKPGVSGYDLEWTYIDSSAIISNKYGTQNTPAFYLAAFQNNATRVNLTDTFTRYLIPLLFEKQGILYARIRSFQNVPNGRRMESGWNSYTNYGFSGHQTNLNWQSSTSFAEEGKRKSVVQYFDGSLRNRQTVTKDNTTRTTVVAEKFYDNQGREAIQVLPAPTLNTIIQYTSNFNSINSGEYDKTHFDKNITGYLCGSGADSMSNNNGASQYYSPSNPNKNIAFNQFIPDAKDYPYSEVRYLPDNTGRIAMQGGVGKMHQIGNGHETRYYYGNPDQVELDGLFGSEVGIASHYFKNMVRDANGQYSVSYIDMHGRTIATALSGNLDSVKLDYLTNKKDSILTKTITDSTNNIVKGLYSESSKTIMITRLDTVLFTYTLPSSTLVIKDCNNNPVNYNCLFDLLVTITDHCNNQTFGGQPYTYTQQNISSASPISFTVQLPEGEYVVTKTLTINEASFENYRDSVFMKKNLCNTLAIYTNNYIDSFKVLHNACAIPNCTSCLSALGTYTSFRSSLISQNAWNPASITTSQESAMSAEYTKQVADCNALCPRDTNQIDQITSDMLSDLTPGGQYADTLNIDIWSIFYPTSGTLLYQSALVHYTDENGKPDTVYINGYPLTPNGLGRADFVNNFKPSWANALLGMHPEYGRLQYMITHVSRGSFYWDNDFNNTPTFQSAYAKGYLNPTGNASFVNKFSNISLPLVSSPPIRDSFYILNNTLLTSMNTKMGTYAMVPAVDTISIWGEGSIKGYCTGNGLNLTKTQIFTSQVPAGPTVNDGQPLEIGVKFQSTQAGYVTGIRFYKTAGNTGIHTGELYSSAGTRLAQATFSSETATGWQDVTFSSPVAISANTTYIASYFSSSGNYTFTSSYFTANVSNSPLLALSNGGLNGANGIYKYTATPAFPTSSPGTAPNYWVDLDFSLTNPNASCVISNKKFPFNDTSNCKGSADMAWKAFAGLYESYKNQQVSTLVTTGSPVSTALNTAFSNGTHTSHFINDAFAAVNLGVPGISASDTTAAGRASTQAVINSTVRLQYNSTCLSYASVWWSQLAPCTLTKLYADSANIISNMVNVCIKGSDANHPYGSSSISADSSYAYASFDTVINFYIAKYNSTHTDSIFKQSCNGELILFPKPYAALQLTTDKPLIGLPDTATCSRVSSLYNAYQSSTGGYTSFSNYMSLVYNTTISDSILNILISRCSLPLSSCTNLSTVITLPPALQGGANMYTISCDRMRMLNNQFTSMYPGKIPNALYNGDDTIQSAINLLYENFMNNQTGFARHTPDYLAFLTSCGSYTAGTYDSLNKLLSGFAQYNSLTHGLRYDFVTQEGQHYNDLHTLSFSGVLHLPDSIRMLSGNWYNNVQFTSTTGAFCWDSGYSVEIRTKFLTDIIPWTPMGDYSFLNIGDVGWLFDRYAHTFTIGGVPLPPGLYIASFNNNLTGVPISQPWTLITSDSNALINWCTLKAQMTPSNYYLYFNGSLVGTYPRDSTASLTLKTFAGLNMLSRQGALDWVKFYDRYGTVKYFEDFNTPDYPAVPDRDYYCPGFPTTCLQDFTTYFNSQRGTSYTYGYIDTLYMTVMGVHPNVCGVSQTINTADTCSRFSYQKTYGGTYTDQFSDIQQTIDGGYITAGTTTSFGNGGNDAYLVKTDKKGNVSWSKTYGGLSFDYFQKVIQTSDSGYIAVGTTRSFHQANGEIFVVKTTANGTVSWSKGFAQGTTNGEIGYDIVQTPADSGYAIVGIYNNAPGLADWEVIKLSKTGAVSWSKRLGTSLTEKIGGILVDADTLVIAGSTYSTSLGDPATKNDAVLFKLNRSTGTLLWSKSYDLESLSNSIMGMAKTANGYKLNVLDAADTITTNGSNIIFDLDRNGVARWAKKLPIPAGATIAYGTGFSTMDKGYVFAQGESSADADIFLHKMDSSGNIVWTNRIKRTGYQLLQKIIQNADSSFAGAGYDSTKSLLIKTDKLGKTSCYDSSYTYTATTVTSTAYTATLSVNSSLTFSNPDIAVTAITAIPTKAIVCSTDVCTVPSYLSGITLSNSATSVFMPQMPLAPLPGPCADSSNWAASRATNVYQIYSDSLKGSFQNIYIGKCLQDTKLELFTMSQKISEYQYTLYYYDQAGNLVKTVPPAGVVRSYDPTWLSQVKTARANGTLLAPAHTLATNYRYNTLNLALGQLTPDAGLSNFWYDPLGRLVLSQNAKQLVEGTNYSYTLYDPLGRISEVGQINTGVGAVTTNTTKVLSQWNTWLANNATNRYQVTNTVYDIAAPVIIAPWLIQNPSTLRNRVSYSTITPGQKGSALVYGTYYNYDIAGNVSTLLQDYGASSPMGINGQEYKRVDYNFDLISGKVNSVAYQSGKPDAFMHYYQYDAENRLTDVFSSADSVTVEHEAHYTYYQHGPLARVLIGANQVQGMDYAYTIQGWLKSVNGTTLNPVNDMGQDGNTAVQSQQYIGRDAYGYSLQYFEGDYYPIAGGLFLTGAKTALGTAYKGLYNGNISSMAVNIGVLNNPKLYNYEYDQLNRITGMDVFNGTNTGLNLWSGTLTSTTDYQERAAYDPNGNIQTYVRNGFGTTLSMDNLTYHYTAATNKLAYITDAVASGNYPNDLDNQSAGNYTYDAAGNLLTDQQAAITANMTWSVYGKLLTISSKSLSYQYDASGNRIGKTAGSTSTWYVRDAQGNVLSVYSGTGMALSEQHLYGSSRLGLINGPTALAGTAQFLDNLGSGTLFTFTRGKKLFELSNHLGNVLATVSDKKFGTPVSGIPSQISYYIADVKTAQDYYPGGMQQPGRIFTSTSSYRYGFNGQEADNEIKGQGNSYTARYWEYDSRSGRRWNQDPIVKIWQSPYETFSGNPIWKTDPNGDDDFFNSNGTFAYRTKSGTNIQVITKEGVKLLSQVQPNNSSNIKALANIVAYYAPKGGIPGGTRVGVSPSSSNTNDPTTNETTNKPSLAFTNGDGIFVSAKNGISPKLNNYNNLISTLFHEDKHKEDNDGGNPKNTFSSHVNVYEKQINDKTFASTDPDYKNGVASNFVSYLLGALKTGEIDDDDFDKKVNSINSKLKSFNITIDAQRELGSDALKPVRIWILGDDGKYRTTQPIKAQATPQ